MRFIKIKNQIEATDILFNHLLLSLKNNNSVSWVVSGGSNIDMTVKVFNKLNFDLIQRLTILLVDERYGIPGHPNSNYSQLESAGLDFSKVKNLKVLKSSALSFDETANEYNSSVSQVFEKSDYIIGQLGIGVDGHTAGILPYTSAVLNTKDLVTNYVGKDYSRITMTLNALKNMSEILVFVFGENKKQVLINLQEKDLSYEEQPSMIFRNIKNVYIINDMIGENK